MSHELMNVPGAMRGHSTSREPATAVFSRRVKPGREAEYENLARQMVETSKAFPGQLAATVVHEKDSADYTVLYSFTDRPGAPGMARLPRSTTAAATGRRSSRGTPAPAAADRS